MATPPTTRAADRADLGSRGTGPRGSGAAEPGSGRLGWFIRSLSPAHGSYGVLLLVAGLLIVPPLVLMVWTSLTPGAGFEIGGSFSLDAYQDMIKSDRFWQVVRNTVVFGTASVICSVLLGSAMAWVVARTDAALKTLIYACVFLQFAVPGMIEAIGWIFLLGRGAGMVNTYLADWFGLPPIPIQSMPGMIFVQTLSLAPLVFLLLVGPFRTIDASLEESARICGATKATIYRRVTLPLLLPSLLSVTILVVIRAMQAFEVPLFLGTPAGVPVFTTEIFGELRASYIPDYAKASAFGSVLVGMLVGVLGIYYKVTRSARKYATVTGKGYRPQVSRLGRSRYLAGAAIAVLFLLYLAPMGAMVFRSFWRRFGADFDIIDSFSVSSYRTMSTFPNLWTGVINSVVIGIISATIAVVITAMAVWIIVRTRIRGRQILDQMLSLPIVIPGTVLGLAFLVTYLRLPVPIYGTIWIFILAYVANYAPYAMRYTQPALLQVGAELEESARVSGARTLMIFRRIVTPLIMPALLGSWLYVFFHAFRDLSIAAMIYTARTPVVATQLLDMWTDGQQDVLAAYGTLISVVSIVVGALAFSYLRRIGFRA